MRPVIQSIYFLTLILLGCTGSSSPENTFSGLAYLFVDSGTLTVTTDTMSGSGSIVFNSPLSSIDSNNSYRIALSIEDGGSVTLVSNSTSQLVGGANVKFSRSGSTLRVILESGVDTNDVSQAFSNVNASTNLSFQTDIHNGENPAHVLVWDADLTSFSTANALLNSEDGAQQFPGRGAGSYWGLILSQASLSAASIDAPKFNEEGEE